MVKLTVWKSIYKDRNNYHGTFISENLLLFYDYDKPYLLVHIIHIARIND